MLRYFTPCEMADKKRIYNSLEKVPQGPTGVFFIGDLLGRCNYKCFIKLWKENCFVCFSLATQRPNLHFYFTAALFGAIIPSYSQWYSRTLILATNKNTHSTKNSLVCNRESICFNIVQTNFCYRPPAHIDHFGFVQWLVVTRTWDK